jgi:predicted DNA-binding protein (MmcQ/YjbR family)
MNVDSLRRYCLSFPQTGETLQWGDDLCFKVNGKIFAVVNLGSVPQGICFKCTPETFAELCEREGIAPAPYVGRYKWVLLDRLDILSDADLREQIRASYEMVASKARTKAKPKPKPRRKTK